MERQLQLGLQFISSESSIKYIGNSQTQFESRHDEVIIEAYKLNSCPNEIQFLKAIEKKIERSEILKNQKCTAGICVLLLASRGYTVTSFTLMGIEDTFIERCWECIQAVSYNTPNPLQCWIKETMGKRLPSTYSVLFCQAKPMSASLNILGNSIVGKGKFSNINLIQLEVPATVWHRNDAVRQTLLLHMKLQI